VLLLPTVSESGWIKDPISIFDRLMAYCLVADHSQTLLYKSHITSIPKIIQEEQGNITNLTLKLSDKLTTYLNRYFKTSSVSVTDVTEDPDDSKVSLGIYVSVTDFNDKTYTFSKLLMTQNGIVKKIIDINNG
jgi:hypothetical protein